MANDDICSPSYNEKCRASEHNLAKKINHVDALKELLHQLKVRILPCIKVVIKRLQFFSSYVILTWIKNNKKQPNGIKNVKNVQSQSVIQILTKLKTFYTTNII